ncbi:MAG: NrfA- nitrite reduction protein [Gammaproteobacteria bacterium]|nr:NrfA- nitrite reduction protein [Gammaproteobacteria bacterium]MYE85846.1 NrfA- nitrite reduction protein [Gammaproteobacteria bacterium]MYF10611.1 NrfA- nitrite reduction protein [Gammaproteobacteria bacterium]MYF49446.1 NrfA- nitrite reduction protein [Gammaproteobacteria bacterium]MYG14790.1 NrfA- nitrite reduction protein [Gammaproteobacteria bacterium]
MSTKAVFWLMGATLVAAAYAGMAMVVGGDRRPLLIGQTTDAHHQIEMACETCHASAPFAEEGAAQRALNQTCRNCHEDELKSAGDSHPRSMFRNPRMAAYWEKLDARLCTTCHAEHRPEITRTGAVTVATDFCIACHSEGDEDVRLNRHSHAGLSFDTCATAGCHNYHDNRALYEDFLAERADEPALKPDSAHGLAVRFHTLEWPVKRALGPCDAVAPVAALADTGVLARWASSDHAASGINCAACHSENPNADTGVDHWIAAPSANLCKSCHKPQAQSFARGRHGMREHPGIAPPRDPAAGLNRIGLYGTVPAIVADWFADPAPPTQMTVGEARLPMRTDIEAHRALDCGTCHGPHAVDTERAAVKACASCHDDGHSRAYFGSPHHKLWQAERSGEALLGSGVSCATCHMPKIESRDKMVTNHNQNDTLRPNEKMIRPVCLDCHGLGFSLDALADASLVGRNFSGSPKIQVESLGWAARRERPEVQH